MMDTQENIDPIAAYDARVADDGLTDDRSQRDVVKKFAVLAQELQDNPLTATPPRGGHAANMGGGFFGRLKQAVTSEKPVDKPVAIKGMYLYGPVGTGKSMLMDIFAGAAGVPVRRVHFHAFLQDVHKRIHRMRKEKSGDPIPDVAADVVEGARVFAFDEIQINDIADAMLVGRLFEAMFAKGIVVVATSNRHPRDLYKDGLNRHLFVPFINMIEARCDVVELDGGRDYRRGRLEGAQVYFTPLGGEADQAMDDLWQDLAGGNGEPLTIDRGGRDIIIRNHRNGVGRSGFNDLCRAALGAGDYLAMMERLEVLMVDHVPVMDSKDQSAAIRFTNLVDVVYEAKKRLILSADAEPEKLYVKGSGAFEFERTASRLIEMQAASWAQDETPQET